MASVSTTPRPSVSGRGSKPRGWEPHEWRMFRGLADVSHSVASYFDYYNHKRRHSALFYQFPQ
ncbi:integrase core domain-containing protein [Hymenobacter sp. BRD128]|uniref:integrase core domain-containing protein n=1 Tax=Hymenobacter sp. BRD128 TaxID=2675878 RepID=UPI00349F49DC